MRPWRSSADGTTRLHEVLGDGRRPDHGHRRHGRIGPAAWSMRAARPVAGLPTDRIARALLVGGTPVSITADGRAVAAWVAVPGPMRQHGRATDQTARLPPACRRSGRAHLDHRLRRRTAAKEPCSGGVHRTRCITALIHMAGVHAPRELLCCCPRGCSTPAPGVPGDPGMGAVPRSVAALPPVSADGLTWTSGRTDGGSGRPSAAGNVEVSAPDASGRSCGPGAPMSGLGKAPSTSRSSKGRTRLRRRPGGFDRCLSAPDPFTLRVQELQPNASILASLRAPVVRPDPTVTRRSGGPLRAATPSVLGPVPRSPGGGGDTDRSSSRRGRTCSKVRRTSTSPCPRRTTARLGLHARMVPSQRHLPRSDLTRLYPS